MPDDRTKLDKLIDMVMAGTRPERRIAFEKADALIEAAGMTWRDVLRQPADADELQAAIEAAQILLRENEALKKMVANGGALAPTVDWMPVGEDPQGKARWMLDQYAAGQIHLNGFELEFCGSIAGLTRPMSEKQEVVFWRIWGSVMARMQRRPP